MKLPAGLNGPSGVDDHLRGRTERFESALEERLRATQALAIGYRRLAKQGLSDAAGVVKWLDACQASLVLDPDLNGISASLVEEWRMVAAETGLRLESDLRELGAARTWRVEGQWPELVVERGVTVRMHPDHVIVGTRRVKPNARAIERELDLQVRELLPKTFSLERFLEQLVVAYDECSRCAGGAVPVLDVYRALVVKNQPAAFWRDARKELFRPLTIDQFRARLSRCLDADIPSTVGRELRLFPPLEPRDALFVYQPAEARFGYIGRLECLAVPLRQSERS